MNLTGNFEQMLRAIFSRYPDYSDNEYITFGILIVDPRQTDTREYITNYFTHFDVYSADYFNFFIPGFRQTDHHNQREIRIRDIDYCFDEKLYYEFCNELLRRFNIHYTFNPMLILMTIQKNDINTAEYIVIELDDNDRNSIRRAGMLFDEIFRIARQTPHLHGIQNNLRKTYMKSQLLSVITNLIGANWLVETERLGHELQRYKIVHR